MARPRPAFSEKPKYMKLEPVRTRKHLGVVGFSEIGHIDTVRPVQQQLLLEELQKYAPQEKKKRRRKGDIEIEESGLARPDNKDSRPGLTRVHGLDEELEHVSPDEREGRRGQVERASR
jgi:hypothetical protein